MIKTSLLVPLLAGSFLSAPSQDKRSADDFDLGGAAEALDADCVRLTPDTAWASGSAWAKTPLDLEQPFDLAMSLSFGTKDELGADGIVFALAPTGRTGWRGEGMGYAGLGTSIGIELDTYSNRRQNDPSADHLALLVNGVPYHHHGAGIVELPNLEDGRRHALRITWAPAADQLKVALDGVLRATYPGAIVRRVFGGATTVAWGLTAGTGRKSNAHDVCFDSK